ncbi:hypothetical protein N0V83_002750 [Neocucurbitaria cava]|uniref:Uncharacterized protein n=1 Tax=Neocucurbitaria cava TaxID=798079 RepID=A0A9W9CNZ8_9PLEO|nr:hypothetical protein N0V83_002750 [Neocucurbitaria cava]
MAYHSTQYLNGGKDEEDALAEAISRSLTDNAAPFSTTRPVAPSSLRRYKGDKIKAKPISMIGHNELTRKDSSHHKPKPKPASASSSTAPHVSLEALHKNLGGAATFLEDSSHEELKVNLDTMAAKVRHWQRKVAQAMHALAVAETKRIEEIQDSLDIDRYIEAQHQAQLHHLNEKWEAELAKSMEEQMKEIDRLRHENAALRSPVMAREGESAERYSSGEDDAGVEMLQRERDGLPGQKTQGFWDATGGTRGKRPRQISGREGTEGRVQTVSLSPSPSPSNSGGVGGAGKRSLVHGGGEERVGDVGRSPKKAKNGF